MSNHSGTEGTAPWETWLESHFEKFTERTRRVLTLAAEEAARLNHPTIDAEDLLVGMIREDEGVAALALRNLGLDLQLLQRSVESLRNQATTRPDGQAREDIGLTEDAKNIIGRAAREARLLKHHYIGTEHLLLGLLREDDGPAVQALSVAGVTVEKARAQVLEILASMRRDPAPAGPKNTVIACRVEDRDLDAIDALIEAGIRTTRSDAASWLISAGIQAQQELFERVYATVAEIRRLRSQAQDIARQVMEQQSARADMEGGSQKA